MKKNVQTKTRMYEFGYLSNTETFCDPFDSITAFLYSQFPSYYCDRMVDYKFIKDKLRVRYEEPEAVDSYGYVSLRLRIL